MDYITGKPQILKQVNLSSIRQVIKNNGAVTRAEISRKANLSATTTRLLLAEMFENNEIVSIGHDASTGGRKAERYKFNIHKYFGVGFCIGKDAINYILVNICGDITETGQFLFDGNNPTEKIISFLDDLVAIKNIKSIGIGVPGIVDNGSYLRINDKHELEKTNIGDIIYQRYSIPVVLENDLNAISLGFSRYYTRTNSTISMENLNMAFIYFEEGCISAGLISEGKIIRGNNNFAGELGLLPVSQNQNLIDILQPSMDNQEYADMIARIIAVVNCVTNPQYIVLGGPNFRQESLDSIKKCCQKYIQNIMLPDITFSSHIENDYFDGMAFLTSQQIFKDIHLVEKE